MRYELLMHAQERKRASEAGGIKITLGNGSVMILALTFSQAELELVFKLARTVERKSASSECN